MPGLSQVILVRALKNRHFRQKCLKKTSFGYAESLLFLPMNDVTEPPCHPRNNKGNFCFLVLLFFRQGRVILAKSYTCVVDL